MDTNRIPAKGFSKTFMLRLFTFFVIVLMPIKIYSQSVSINNGFIYQITKTIKPIINQSIRVDNNKYWSIQFCDIQIKDNIKSKFTFSKYRGWSGFNVKDSINFYGAGYSITDLYRFGFVSSYSMKSKLFSFKPYLGFTFENSNRTWEDGEATVFDAAAPDYVGKEIEKSIERNQILPTIGTDLLIHFTKRLFLQLEYQFTYGYKPFQTLTVEYSYKGIKQPNAEWKSDGTAHFATIGIGYVIWKNKKDSNNKKSRNNY